MGWCTPKSLCLSLFIIKLKVGFILTDLPLQTDQWTSQWIYNNISRLHWAILIVLCPFHTMEYVSCGSFFIARSLNIILQFIFHCTHDQYQSADSFWASNFLTLTLCSYVPNTYNHKIIVLPKELWLFVSIGTFLTNYDVSNRKL